MLDVRELSETTELELFSKLLNADKSKVFIAVQVAPAVRVLIGEKIGLARGEDSLGKVSAALRAMGVDAVVDAAIAQDALTLSLVKELKRNKEKGDGPVVVGKCQGKASPMEIHARLLRKYYAAKEAGKAVFVVSVVCCEKAKHKIKGADLVLTVDELWSALQKNDCNLRLLKKGVVDTPFGIASGAAYICASAGGKAEAVARCLMEDKSRIAVQKLAYSGLYGDKAVREGVIVAEGREWKFAVVACPDEAERISAEIEAGTCAYDFVEFTCGGCIRHGLEDCDDKVMTLKLRGLGLRYLDRAHAARSADMSAYAAVTLKAWEGMVRLGEAFAEIPSLTEETLNALFVEEPVVEETLAVEPAEEPAVEVLEEVAVAQEVPVEEAPTEEPVEEPVETVEEVIEEPVEAVEEVIEEPVEAVEEVVEEPVETIEEVIEEPVETIEEVIEEPVETVEEVVEEPVETIEEVIEDPVEAVEEVVEEPVETVEEVIEEPVETVEEVIEEPVETVEEVVEEPVETVEEVVEEPVETVEEVVEEPVEEVAETVEEVAEETVIEEPVEEVAPVEEETPVEETPLQEVPVENEASSANSPYYRRLSTAERRKLKRKNKK